MVPFLASVAVPLWPILLGRSSPPRFFADERAYVVLGVVKPARNVNLRSLRSSNASYLSAILPLIADGENALVHRMVVLIAVGLLISMRLLSNTSPASSDACGIVTYGSRVMLQPAPPIHLRLTRPEATRESVAFPTF